MWVVCGEDKMSREEWEKEHQNEIEIGMYAIHGWVYEETYEKYCAEFDKQKAELMNMVDGVAKLRNELLNKPYGADWEETYDIYSDVFKSAYGYRPRDKEIFERKGITSEMREAVFKEMDELRKKAWAQAS